MIVLLPAGFAAGALHALDAAVLPEGLQLGQDDLLGVVDHLFADHDDGQLLRQLHQTAARRALPYNRAVSTRRRKLHMTLML